MKLKLKPNVFFSFIINQTLFFFNYMLVPVCAVAKVYNFNTAC